MTTLVNLITARLGWDASSPNDIMTPTTEVLRDMDTMVEYLHTVHTSQALLVILPDFDMDGISAGVLGLAGFDQLGFNVALFTPDYREGHDITPATIARLHEQYPDVHTIITCDAGVNSHEGLGEAKARGIGVLVTDHHTQMDTLSPADIIVDPCRLDETYPEQQICGASVLWYVLKAYTERYDPANMRPIEQLVLLAGLGTVGDVMPLTHTNRITVKKSLGLAFILQAVSSNVDNEPFMRDIQESLLGTNNVSDVYWRVFTGFMAIFKGFAEYRKRVPTLVDGKLSRDTSGQIQYTTKAPRAIGADSMTATTYGFYIAPLFNAIRRIGSSLQQAFDVFTADTHEAQYNAVCALIDGNELRKVTKQVYTNALQERDQPFAPYIWLSDAPRGMQGLIAMDMVNAHGVPTAVIDPTTCLGSGRAPDWFDMLGTMTPLGYHLLGHPQACGVLLTSMEEVEAYARDVQQAAQTQHQAFVDQQAADLARQAADPSVIISGAVVRLGGPHGDWSLDDTPSIEEAVTFINRFEPFGQGFPRPLYELDIPLSTCVISHLGGPTHLQIKTATGLKIVWWQEGGQLERLEALQAQGPGRDILRVVADGTLNTFRGATNVQFIIQREVAMASAQ